MNFDALTLTGDVNYGALATFYGPAGQYINENWWYNGGGDFSFIVIGDTGEGDASQHALRDQLLTVSRRDEVKFVIRDRADYEYARDSKQASVGDLRRYGFELRLAIEDDRRNVEMFRTEGVPCIYFHSGYYD